MSEWVSKWMSKWMSETGRRSQPVAASQSTSAVSGRVPEHAPGLCPHHFVAKLVQELALRVELLAHLLAEFSDP